MHNTRQLHHIKNTLRGLSMLASVLASCFAIINFARDYYAFAVIEIIFSVAIFLIYLQIKKSEDILFWAFFFSALVSLTFLTAMTFARVDITAYGWLFVFPVLYYLLLGSQHGRVLTTLIILLTAFVYGYRFWGDMTFFNVGKLLNFASPLLVVWLFTHIFERSRELAQSDLFRMASHDPLTGLLNRVQLESIFTREYIMSRRRDEALSLIIIDLDYFKKVNDQYGHQVGDQVLCHFARLLNENIRRSDYAFRVGGEEFCIILPGATAATAEGIANKILSSIGKARVNIGNVHLAISFSAGIASIADDGDQFKQLYRKADQRLYQAKRNGRHQICGPSTGVDIAHSA